MDIRTHVRTHVRQNGRAPHHITATALRDSSAKNCPKLTSLSPAPVQRLFGRHRDICPDATFSKMHVHERFCEDRTSGKWSKSPDRQGRTDVYIFDMSKKGHVRFTLLYLFGGSVKCQIRVIVLFDMGFYIYKIYKKTVLSTKIYKLYYSLNCQTYNPTPSIKVF